MFNIGKLYDLSIINEANTDFKEEDIIIRLEKSYYNELLKDHYLPLSHWRNQDQLLDPQIQPSLNSYKWNPSYRRL